MSGARRGVRIFLDFLEDGRVSMENYADELSDVLVPMASARFEIDHFRPKYCVIPGLPKGWNDRIARYVAYPAQASNAGRDVNHIIDHGYAHLLSRLPARRTVITVHDIIPLLASIGKIPGASHRRPWLGNYSLSHFKRAGALIVVSETTKRDLAIHLNVDESRMHVAHNGLSSDFRVLEASKEELRVLLGLPLDAFLVLITGRQFYKNHSTSIRVLNSLRKSGLSPGPKLICMGRLTPDARALVREFRLYDQVTEYRAPDRAALVRLYNAVDCLLFPSHYEGFGWPPLEAMACGVPVVCSNAGALPEIAGNAAAMFEPLDVAAFSDAIAELLSSKASRTEIRDAGIQWTKRYSWRGHAESVLEVYDSL